MSADDFQAKYACFMDGLVKNTVAETTKLFETVVDELKAELSKVKTENEALKTTCRQIADAKTVVICESGQSAGPRIQDTAVQCDLLPCHLLLIEQPVGQSIDQQGKQCNEEEMVYILLNDQDCDAEKEQNPNLTASLPNHKDSEPTAVSSAVAAPPPTSACGNETNGPEINQQCSNEKLSKSHDTQVATVHPSLQVDHNQSLVPVNYLLSLATTRDNVEMASNAGQLLADSATQELKISHVRTEHPSFRETPVHEQAKGPPLLSKQRNEEKTKCSLMEVQVNKNSEESKQHSEKVPETVKKTRPLPSTGADGANLTASSLEALSHPLGIRGSSVMVQDAMLLIEAMDQSKTRTSLPEKPTAQGLCTPSVVTSPSVVQSPLPTEVLPSQSPPTAKLSVNGAKEVSTNRTLLVTSPTESRSYQSHIGVPTEHQQKHDVGSSDMTSSLTATGSKSLEQCTPHSPSLLANPLETKRVSDPIPQKVSSKSPSTQPQCPIATLSPKQTLTVVSTPVPSSSSGVSQRKKDLTSTTAAPLDTSDRATPSPEQKSDPMHSNKIKSVIDEAREVVTSQPQSEILVASSSQNSVGPGVTMSSSSQHPNTGARVASDEKETPLATEETPFILSPLPSPQLESSSQQTNICLETTPGEQAALPTESVPIKSSTRVPGIRIKRLPNMASSTGSFWVSQLFGQERGSGVVPPDSASSLTNDRESKSTVCPSKVAASSTSLSPNLKETLVAEIIKAPSISEKALPCSTLEEAPVTGLSACTPSCVPESVLETTTKDCDKAESSAVSDQARQTCTLDEEINYTAEDDFVSPSDFSPTPITKDLSEPRLQSTKPQLAVTPVIPDAEKISTNESADGQSSCDERTSTHVRRKLHKKSIIARLGIHLKTYSRTKRTKTNAEPHTDEQSVPERSKKPRLENGSTTEQSYTHKAIPVSTNSAIPLSPTGKETGLSQLSLMSQRRSTNISCTESKTDSVRLRNPVVRLYRLPLKDTTDSNCPPSPLRKTLTSPKKSLLSPVSQNESRIITNVPSSTISNCERLWIYTLSEEQTSKRNSNSLMGKSGSPGARSPKSSKIGEFTAKKSPLNQKSTVPENEKAQNAKKLANANTVAKNKPTKSKLPAHVGNKTGNESTSESVCTPPKVRAGNATQATAALQAQSFNGSLLLKSQCAYCGRILSSNTALESHVSLHTGLRPFSCTRCTKSFPDRRGLKRHTRVHRRGRTHVCKQCGKSFVYGFGLTKHVQMVHEKIKPFVCQICSKAFFTRRDVETHIRVHTGERPFHCNLCDKTFMRGAGLNGHLRWHRGEKRHWCPYCGKGFLDQNNLKRHKYIHTGEKPESCPHCPKHFKQSGHLKKHVRTMHKSQ